jgi:Recombination endonuclease VII
MECKEEDCQQKAICRGWCNRHYDQWRRLGKLIPPTLTCVQCGESFILAKYRRKFCSSECSIKYHNHQRSLKPRPQRTCACGAPAMHQSGKPVCADCRIDARSRPYRLEYYLDYTLRRYGLTRADYDQMLAAQHGRCAVCRSKTPKGPGRWHIDHDHITGQVRGLLCNNCNRGIGYFSDDPEVIKAAARYVTRHRQMELFSRKAG